jgi:predicted metalloprotease with PDZ domain
MRPSAVAALAASVLMAVPAGAATAPLMTVLIKPGVLSESAGGHVDVRITVPGMDVPASGSLFTLPDMAPNMPSPQPRTNVVVTDAEGPVPVAAPERAGSRPWTASRRVYGDVTVSYRLPIDNARGSGPPIVLRIDGDTFSTPGRMLLALPDDKTAYRVAIRWDVSAMGPGAIGVSGYGDGDVEIVAGPASRLSRTMFMAGHFKREPQTPRGGFSALWGGEPPFDPRPLMQWTGKLHAWMSRFFHDTVEPPYRVVLRSNPQNPGGGVAMTQSFAVGYGPKTTAEGLKAIFGHEMTHTWTAIEPLGKWYSEGNAVFYQSLLPWRAGLIDGDAYLADLNETALRYYANPMKATPESEVLAKFWDDTQVRVLPYDRGALYFAVLNGKIVRASGGRRSIDDLIRVMIGRFRANPQAVTEETWLGLLRQEIGEEGPATHRAMMAGELVVPRSDDFGPCFERTTIKVRAFEPGFDLPSVSGSRPERIIRNLKPGSEAAKAGLREGDKVLSAPFGDAMQNNLDRMVTVKVSRQDKPFDFTYLPRGEPVDIYQWVRKAGDTPGGCQ